MRSALRLAACFVARSFVVCAFFFVSAALASCAALIFASAAFACSEAPACWLVMLACSSLACVLPPVRLLYAAGSEAATLCEAEPEPLVAGIAMPQTRTAAETLPMPASWSFWVRLRLPPRSAAGTAPATLAWAVPTCSPNLLEETRCWIEPSWLVT
ncbi:hypothetical protein GA0115252_12193 [Streptomyces sp. DfronAA-171]|nr:hypothetical protein GA0115252_12193 [Streptomyces sp. DfronAA-171]